MRSEVRRKDGRTERRKEDAMTHGRSDATGCCRSSAFCRSVVPSFRPSVLLAPLALCVLLSAPLAAQEPVDQATIARIRDEGLARSRVGETFDHLTNVIGPRLTGSPQFKQAVDWTTERLRSYGLSGVHQESWPFGRGWSLEKLTLEMVEPWYLPLTGFPEAWTPSPR